MEKRMSTTETAKAVRESLKQAFPRTKFSVRSKSYSGGSSVSVYWTDGPTTKQVQPILNCFEGAGFDGMQDLKYYQEPCDYKGELVRWGADFVTGSRHDSLNALKLAAFKVAEECELPLLKIAGPNESVYSSSSVEGGNYLVDWHYRDGEFSYDPRHVCLPTNNHAELIYQVARDISFEERQDSKHPNRVTQQFVDTVVQGMIQ